MIELGYKPSSNWNLKNSLKQIWMSTHKYQISNQRYKEKKCVFVRIMF
jgi:hypothetical protein